MQQYYLNNNAQSNGDHEVHIAGCSFFPNWGNVIRLGYHQTCSEAVREAKKHHKQSNGCAYCVSACHTS